MNTKVKSSKSAVADLHGKIVDAPPIPTFFIFMQFSANFGYVGLSATDLCNILLGSLFSSTLTEH